MSELELGGAMSDNRPYLLRAFYEWIVDNACTPMLFVGTQVQNLQLPPELIAQDNVVLNIAPHACVDLLIGNEALSFKARFSGVSHEINIPVTAVLGLFARETQRGIQFELSLEPASGNESTPQIKKKPLKWVSLNSQDDQTSQRKKPAPADKTNSAATKSSKPASKVRKTLNVTRPKEP